MKKINFLEYSSLMWFILRSCFAELTMSTLLLLVRQDSWISVALGSIIGLFIFIIYEHLRNKYPEDDIVTLNKKLWKNKGNFINIILLIGCLITIVFTFWILIHFSSTLFLYKTSLWIISIAFIIPIGYASSKDIHIISKISLIIFYISILFNSIITIGLFSNIDLSNLKPIMESGYSKTFLSSLLFLNLTITKLIFLNIIPKKNINNYSSKKSILMYLFITLSMLEIVITTIGVFGINLALLYEYPAFQVLKRVNILGIFDRIESILSIEALFASFIQITLATHFSKEVIKKTFNLNKKANNYIVIFICTFVFIISNTIFITHESGENFVIKKLSYILSLIFILVPLLTLIKSLLFQNNIKLKK